MKDETTRDALKLIIETLSQLYASKKISSIAYRQAIIHVDSIFSILELSKEGENGN